MSKEERTGFRDTVFSKWRRASGKSTLVREHTAQDIDWLEYCYLHKTPLALIEGVCCEDSTKLLRAARKKYCVPLKKLAEIASIDAYVMAYVTDKVDVVTCGLFLNIQNGSITEILDSDGISLFIHNIHKSCSQCDEANKNLSHYGFSCFSINLSKYD